MSEKKPCWIWFPGDFEIYHSLHLHLRREEHERNYPAFWKLDDCFHNVKFKKEVDIAEPDVMEAFTNGVGYLTINGKKFAYNQKIPLEKGHYTIHAMAAKPDGLPCVYIQSRQCPSDGSWNAYNMGNQEFPAGCTPRFEDISKTPETFPFSYERIYPVDVQEGPDGVLYDFGKETFAKVHLDDIQNLQELNVSYGESIEEARDWERTIIRETVSGVSSCVLKPRAFRYLFLPGKDRNVCAVSADYEYLPLEYKGSFACDDETINKVWAAAAYTFHLNSREFFLDGIKRDRWVWSGDAFQSYMINNYLFFDKEIDKRTIIALRGKDPVERHINTILDYSFYWIISILNYYQTTKDLEFVASVYPKMVTLMDFCLGRREEHGFCDGRDGDWIFIDWSEMDKDGPLCAEQILLARSLDAMALCSGLLGKDSAGYEALARETKEKINRYYWSEEKGAYIDSFTSGRKHVTRHANIFAILFDYVTQEQKESILKNVLLNDEITQITTPYFKFYELDAMCKLGYQKFATQQMLSYWGGMIHLGATTIWEEYDPKLEGAAHYSMYGEPYGKSLCHAWGGGPVYLLGRYYLGVVPTAPGYETFDIAPSLGGLKWMKGTVPVEGGLVEVEMDEQRVTVRATRPGGTLRVNGQSYLLTKDEPLTVSL